MATNSIHLDGPKTLVLSPQTIALIVDALGDRPYKQTVAAINEIMSQLQPPPVG